MLPSILIITAVATARAEPTVPAPLFTVGDELVYTGEVAEESTRIDLPYKRKHELEVHLFVLSVQDGVTDLAVMTLVRPKIDATIAGAASAVTGVDPLKSPPAVRLSLVRVDSRGRSVLLKPKSNPPFMLDAKTPSVPVPSLPLDAPAGLELGFLVPLADKPAKLGTQWTATDRDRPDFHWTANQMAVLNGTQVLELTARQQSAKWDSAGGLDSSWRRSESVWIASADGLARQFTRTIEIKDGVHIVETRTTTCTMASPPSPNRGDGYSSIRKEIEHAIAFTAELESGRAVRLLDRIESFERRHRETPYRIAIEAVKRRLK